ncbi:MAG: hypothetical protein M1491_05855 [Deltaproteobacteria bacterium]|nr:hypothetical protein [Deltaproteobacteria bacterium]MCL5277076.1 hypothetical protein [Deltaproteobacteria bacterium]
MDLKSSYRHFRRRFEEMDDYERTRLYTITGIIALACILAIVLAVFISLRRLDVVIGVDTTGLLGRPAVFINNTSSSSLKHVSIEMDGMYTAEVDMIRPRLSVVVYFTTFKPIPPQNYRPREITVRSGLRVMTKSIPPF